MTGERTSTDDVEAEEIKKERSQQPGECVGLQPARSQQPAAGGIRTPWIVNKDPGRKRVLEKSEERAVKRNRRQRKEMRTPLITLKLEQ